MADHVESSFKELPIASRGPIAHSPSNADPILGIDLGTTNSLVALVKRSGGAGSGAEHGVPVVIPTKEGKNLLPSVVHFNTNGVASVGFAARARRVSDPANTIYSVKRLLGRGASDVAALKEQLPFTLEASSENNIKIKAGEKTLTPIEVSALILRELKEAAEEHLGRTVEDAVITVPAYFNDSQRQATRAAGRLAGLNVLRILNEPTAASLAYGLEKKQNGLIAVYDLGGGTFDVSILRLRDGIFEVLATNGDTQLGGDDLDQAVADWMRSFQKTLSQADLLSGAESLKIQLSESENAAVTVQDTSFTLTRAQFSEIVKPVLERTKKPVEQALKDAGLEKNAITDVVLVGGPTRLHVIRDYVASLFGRTPNWSMHPDEVVALGAAIQADILAGNNKDFLLLDVVPLSLGIETFGGAMTKLIGRNTRIPTMAKEQFTTYVDGQTKVAINVFQGERELVQDNRKLAEFVLNGVPPLPAGVARVEVTFLVDADAILNVAAKEIYSEVEASIEVKPTYGLTDAEVERMLEAGLLNQEADKKQAALIEAKNEARRVLEASQKALDQVRSVLAESEVAKIEALLTTLRSNLETSRLAEIKSSHAALNLGTQNLAQVLMNKTLKENLENKRVSDIIEGDD